MQRHSETEDVRHLLLDGLADLGRLELSGAVRAALPILLRTLRAGRDGDDWNAAIDRVRAELLQLREVLGTLQERLTGAAGLTPETDAAAWWQDRRRSIESAEAEGRHTEAVALCVDRWTDALSAGAVVVCAQIADLTRRLDTSVSAAMTTVADGIGEPAAEPPAAAPPAAAASAALRRMLAETDGPLSPATAVRLDVLRARLLLRSGDLDAALAAGRDAVARAQGAAPGPDHALTSAVRLLDLAPETDPACPEESLALTALAEVTLALGRLDEARTLAHRAETAVVPPPDTLVLAGLIAEADRAWPVADDCYVKALDRGATGEPTPLLRPTPARLKVADARRRRGERPAEAIALFESALADGVPGEGTDATEIKVELARLLRGTDRDRAAARYADAANDYAAAGLHARAAEFYAAAAKLRPDVAEYWWLRAESLRMQAVRAGGMADEDLLRRAREALDRGSTLAGPDAEHAWVLVTEALLATPLDGPRLEQLVLLERALLLNPDYAAGRTFLVDQLRERGYVHDALAAAEQNAARSTWDGTALQQLAAVRIEAGDYPEAVTALDGQLWLEPDGSELVYFKALALARQGAHEAALETLKTAESTSWVRLLRAYTHALRDDLTAMRREFRKLYHTARTGDEHTMTAWAGFHTGDPELMAAAIDVYAESAGTGTPGGNEDRDLGQMLLVRGDQERGDLARGERLLRDGVAASNSPDDLLQLRTVELVLVRRYVAGQPHEPAVAAVLDDAESWIETRRGELLARRLDPESLPGRLAAARSALAGGDPAAAFAGYLALLRDSALPGDELLGCLGRAGGELVKHGDREITRGSVPDALAAWDVLLAAGDVLPRLGDLGLRMRARRFAGWCALGRSDEAERELLTVLAADRKLDSVGPATRAFAGQPEMLWAVYDGLTAIAVREDLLDRAQRAELRRVARDLPFATAHRLGRDELATRSAAPAVNALEVRLGAAHHDLHDEPLLNQGIVELRDAIAAEMGIRIQGVRLSRAGDELAGGVEFRLYEEEVGRLTLPREGRAQLVLATLERIVRERLYRLITPDDVVLWLAGWNADRSAGAASAEAAPATAEERLAMARLLRLLLREGVPIRDRQALLEVFADCGADAGPLVLLRAARRRLRADLAAQSPPGRRVPLPAALEDRIAAGLTDAGRWWEIDRTEARAIVAGLESWLSGDATGRTTVVVRDPAVRPYVWRLLAARRPPVRVVAEEELT